MHSDTSLNILLVEDDERLAGLTRQYLENHGNVVTVVHDGKEGLQEALRYDFDAVLLDLMLPGMDGIQICQQIRQHKDVPIIMLTARGEEADRVLGLEIGADDYMPKPFSPRELLARLRAIIRRSRGGAGPSLNAVTSGNLRLLPASARAELDGRLLDLTSYEFAILLALVKSTGRILTREQIMEIAGGNPDEAFDRSVDVHISRLRKKLGDSSNRPNMIRTVRGLGYMFMAAED